MSEEQIISHLTAQRDSLLSACNIAISFFETDARSEAHEQTAYDVLRDAVAKVDKAKAKAGAKWT